MGTPDAAWSADVEFVEFVRARQHTLLRAAYLVCADLRLAEELLEAALVRLAGDWEEVRDERPEIHVRRLLYRDAVSSWRRRPHVVNAPEPAGDVGDGERVGEVDEVYGVDEAEEAEEAEQRREVLRALDALTPRQRAVVVLRHFDERTDADAARILGVPVGTVTSEAAEALARLRAALPRVDLGTGGAR